ncbi:MAG: response regulator [Anaerocolumna sp.]
MTVLIVDDQINVVSGIMFGVNWEKIRVSRVLKAYNAYEAKKILSTDKVDVMLCDIEMPVENGLSLFQWVQTEELELECIFLTAHADFMYAKEALRLGSFDYILQPARYEEIESAITRALAKLQVQKQKEKFSSLGKLVYSKRDVFLAGIVKELFFNKDQNLESILQDLKSLGIRFQEEKGTYVCLIQIQRFSKAIESWETQLLYYAMNNIIDELFSPYGQKIILLQIDRENYGFITYTEEKVKMDKGAVDSQLLQLIDVYAGFYECGIACYAGECIKVNRVYKVIQELENIKRDNVSLQSKVFFISSDDRDNKEERKEERKEETAAGYCRGWDKLMLNGAYESVRMEAITVLEQLTVQDRLTADSLQRFYHDYMRIIHEAAGYIGIQANQLFEEDDILSRSLNAYRSVDEMKWLIHYTISFFNEATISEESQKKIIEQILQYIRSNLDKDIRRNDVADIVYLNPNYVSRLFKNEIGVPLKEYIVAEKMKLARAMIKSTNMSISMIAVKVGYSNFSHFSQVYKKMTGISPSEERTK